MALTKEIKISSIKVEQTWKHLDVDGSTIVKDGDEVIAQKPYQFAISPNVNLGEFVAYQNLPDTEKVKVMELVNTLWTDEVKDNYTKSLASQKTPE
jgi:protein tyrosine phosphatase